MGNSLFSRYLLFFCSSFFNLFNKMQAMWGIEVYLFSGKCYLLKICMVMIRSWSVTLLLVWSHSVLCSHIHIFVSVWSLEESREAAKRSKKESGWFTNINVNLREPFVRSGRTTSFWLECSFQKSWRGTIAFASAVL